MRDESKFLQPVECSQCPGFYEIPGYPLYAISRDGKLYSKLQCRVINGYKNTCGYHIFTLCLGEERRQVSTGRHRLLCLTFKNDGRDYSQLQVNHIDHTPGHDALDNLEWTTARENRIHACANPNRIKRIVEVRNPRTGEIRVFTSIPKLLKELNIKKITLLGMLVDPDWRIYPCGYQVRLLKAEPWPPLPSNEDEIARIMHFNNRANATLVKWLISGKVAQYETLQAASIDLGISTPVLSGWINEPVQRIGTGGFLIKYAYDSTPWRDDIRSMDDMFVIYNSQGDRKIVQRTHYLSGMSEYYWTAARAARAAGITVTALDYRLKTQGNAVFEDLYMYGYYPFVPDDPSSRFISKGIIYRNITEYIRQLTISE